MNKPYELLTHVSGRPLVLGRLQQFLAHDCLLTAAPTLGMNHLLVRATLNELRARSGLEPYLIPPPGLALSGEEVGDAGSSPLPPVVCSAELRSSGFAREADADYSRLVVVWFQDRWAFPIEPLVLDALRGLSWSERATDCWF